MHAYKILLYILYTAELTACICGFASWYKWKGSPWRWFSFYLLFIVLSEAFGEYTYRYKLSDARDFFFNYINIPAQFFIAFYIFYRVGENKTARVLPLICAGIYITSWLANKLYLGQQWYSLSYTTGNLLLLVLILRFLLALASSKEILNFKRNILFWICTGWMLYYLGTLPYYGLRNTLAEKYYDLFVSYSYVVQTLNITMYLLFSVGFLWSKPRSAYS